MNSESLKHVPAWVAVPAGLVCGGIGLVLVLCRIPVNPVFLFFLPVLIGGCVAGFVAGDNGSLAGAVTGAMYVVTLSVLTLLIAVGFGGPTTLLSAGLLLAVIPMCVPGLLLGALAGWAGEKLRLSLQK